MYKSVLAEFGEIKEEIDDLGLLVPYRCTIVKMEHALVWSLSVSYRQEPPEASVSPGVNVSTSAVGPPRRVARARGVAGARVESELRARSQRPRRDVAGTSVKA